MAKQAIWKRDWVVGLVLAGLAVAAFSSRPAALLDGKAYDFALRGAERVASDRVAIIEIDDQSLANLGRWPWPRDVHAKLLDILAGGQPKVIANLAFFSEPERDRGLAYINKLRTEYASLAAAGVSDTDGALARIGALLKEADVALDTDRQLAASMSAAGNVVGPVVFRLDRAAAAGNPDKALPAFMERSSLKPSGGVGDPLAMPLPAGSITSMPIEPIGAALAGIGHLNAHADPDGVYRSNPLVVSYFGYLFPSLALVTAAHAINSKPTDIKIEFGAPVKLGNLEIGTVAFMQMRPYFYRADPGRTPFQADSFFDVYAGKVPPAKFKDKVVLIGPTAAGLGASQPTPTDAAMPAVAVLAHTVSSILQQHYVTVPQWADGAALGALVLIAAYLMFGLPRLAGRWGAAASAVLLAALLAGPYFALTQAGQWVGLTLPAGLLVAGHALLTTKRYLLTEAGKVQADAESADSNRMLGLAFQGQGQLDMAFDKLRRAAAGGAMSEALMENLYGLALDFERKRQFNKAESVFRFMADHDPGFRDLPERLARAKQLSETVILGGGSSSGGGTQILTAGGVEKPMLGRYQLEKEIGRGAMGAVYLGRDPKIGRVVAVKTMALAQEFEGDELAEVKQRFFREAETAGRLNHPNIVTIFDAGEEHDLAYIAMEFLKGEDLTRYTKPETLLPFPVVVSVVARVAEALDYAHKQNIVHRDIKPANIMYDPSTDAVKVTDFGIARITDASKTKTGMVLGTPTYMSPEQLHGRHIDGRSDLFSLAVTLFQMACGRAPYTGDSMAQLMFRIANEPTPDITAVDPRLPRLLAGFLNKAMAKDAHHRFQNGYEFAQSLRRVAAVAAAGGNAPATAPAAAPAAAPTAG